MRAISAFDHSRIAAMSASAVWRSSSASPAERVWIDSTCAFASAWRRARVSSRVDSAAVCMAFVRSAISLFGLRVGAGSTAAGGVSPRRHGSNWAGDWAASVGVSFTRGLASSGVAGSPVATVPSSATGSCGRGGLVGRVGLGPVGAPRELESRPGVGRGHASGSSVGSGRIGDVQGVAACCQPWMVWWSPLEVPAVGPGGTAAPPDAHPVPDGTATNRGAGTRMWHS